MAFGKGFRWGRPAPRPGLAHALQVEGQGGAVQDRAAVIEAEGGALVIALADGAGGSAYGGRAAETVVRGLETLVGRGVPLTEGRTWTAFLAETDRAIARDREPGETTAVVLAVAPAAGSVVICGASVGDSEAWLVAAGGWHDLTAGQRRKPLLGSGAAVPVPFRGRWPGGVLVVGSDGLFQYAGAALVRAAAPVGTPAEACRALVDLARLPGGGLQDDAAVVVCRVPTPGRAPGG